MPVPARSHVTIVVDHCATAHTPYGTVYDGHLHPPILFAMHPSPNRAVHACVASETLLTSCGRSGAMSNLIAGRRTQPASRASTISVSALRIIVSRAGV